MPGPSPSNGSTADSEVVFAPAKINLNLRVGPVRPDGFHPLDSFVVQLEFADRLTLRDRPDGQVSLTASGPDCGPADANLAVRAARLAQAAPGWAGQGVAIELDKQIPPGMGLGGGSSDAAAVLKALRRRWRLDWSDAQVAAAALELGSDVPLFLGTPAARMRGRGEWLEPLTVAPLDVVLVLPELHCATGPVYRAFDALPPPEPDDLAAGALARPVGQWRHRLVNDLAPAARQVCPPLARLWDELSSLADVPVHLTGSGAGLFALCDDAAHARRLAAALAGPARRCLATRTAV